MTKIELGFAMPGSLRDKSRQSEWLPALHRALDLASGHCASAWIIDHLQFDDRLLLEGWVGLSYLMGQYPQLQFGHAVLCQSFRNPGLTAKMAASAQVLSGGRFILGIGAGWKEDEYAAYGYDFPPAGQRVDELAEYLQVVKALWTEERASFSGKYYSVEQAWCEPKPEPLPPIMIGGSKPRMLRLVAQYADWWNVSWTGIADFRAQSEQLERACAELGRDPASLRRTWFGGCIVGKDEAEVERLNAGLGITSETAFIGTPPQVVEQMRPFVELGVDCFMLGCGGFPELTTLELLIGEVLPALNR